MVEYILEAILIIFGVPYLFSLLFVPFYFKFGLGKWFFHDIMGWHIPDRGEKKTHDGLSYHSRCKHCGKEIMQDSQGNWFAF